MIDLTHHSDRELSWIVFNNEYFYTERHNIPYLLHIIDEGFIYTPKQMDVLITDLDDDW